MPDENKPIYEHTQFGYVTVGASMAGALLTCYAFLAERGRLGASGFASVGGLVAVASLFSSLTVKVSRNELWFYFGPGFWKRRFPLDDILDSKVVRNAFYQGWGIRRTSSSWLYNVSGLEAVEFDTRNDGTIRIGSNEPRKLKQAVEQARQST